MLKRHPTSPNTYVFGFVEINSCEVKRESSLTKQNFFVTIMLKFNKVLNSRIIALILICVFLVTNTAYGMDLSEKPHLRKPLDFNNVNETKRYSHVLKLSSATIPKELKDLLSQAEPVGMDQPKEFSENTIALKAELQVCIAVVSRDKNTGRIVFSHFFPNLPEEYRPKFGSSKEEFIQAKKIYIEEQLKGINSRDWDIAVISSKVDNEWMKELEDLYPISPVLVEDIKNWLNIGDKNINRIGKENVVLVDRFGRVFIIDSQRDTVIGEFVLGDSDQSTATSPVKKSLNSLLTQDRDKDFFREDREFVTFNQALELLSELGVKEGFRIVDIGPAVDYTLGLAATKLGVYYTSYELNKKFSDHLKHFIERYNTEEFGGSFTHTEGEFSAGQNSKSKDIKGHSQDVVIMFTGVLSDPAPESDSLDVFREALRVIKPGGKIIVGTYGTWEWEEGRAHETMAIVLKEPRWIGKVKLEQLEEIRRDSIYGRPREGRVYKVIFFPEYKNRDSGSIKDAEFRSSSSLGANPFAGSKMVKNSEASLDSVTKEEVEAVLEDMNRHFEYNSSYDKQKIRAMALKILKLGIIKGKSFLVVGPSHMDLLPIFLAKLGLKTTIIDIDESSVKYQKMIYEKIGIKDKVEAFTSYTELGDRKFDYVSILGVVHEAAFSAELVFSDSGAYESRMKEFLIPIVKHLNLESGYIFVNTSQYTNSLRYEKGELDSFKRILSTYGNELNTNFILQPDADINNFSMHLGHLQEKRIGRVYKAETQVSSEIKDRLPQKRNSFSSSI